MPTEGCRFSTIAPGGERRLNYLVRHQVPSVAGEKAKKVQKKKRGGGGHLSY